MIHRLNNIPLDEKDYKDELNTTKYLAESNGYEDVYKRQVLSTSKSVSDLYYARVSSTQLKRYSVNRKRQFVRESFMFTRIYSYSYSYRTPQSTVKE